MTCILTRTVVRIILNVINTTKFVSKERDIIKLDMCKARLISTIRKEEQYDNSYLSYYRQLSVDIKLKNYEILIAPRAEGIG